MMMDLVLRPEDPRTPVFERPAELVDIAERAYREILSVGMWIAVVLCVLGALASLLYSDAGSQMRGSLVCGAYAVACVAAAKRPHLVYSALRTQPRWLVGVGLALGLGAWYAGPENYQLYLPIVAVIGVPGIVVTLGVVAVSGAVAAAGLAAPHLISGEGHLAGPMGVLVPPLVFWFIVDRIAAFTLQLHESLTSVHSHAFAPSVRHGSTYTPRSSGQAPRRKRPRLLPQPPYSRVGDVMLTARQLQVILLLCEGLNHREVGCCLEIGAVQVGRHIKNACHRVGAATEAELAAWAWRRGLVPGATPQGGSSEDVHLPSDGEARSS